MKKKGNKANWAGLTVQTFQPECERYGNAIITEYETHDLFYWVNIAFTPVVSVKHR